MSAAFGVPVEQDSPTGDLPSGPTGTRICFWSGVGDKGGLVTVSTESDSGLEASRSQDMRPMSRSR